MIEATRERHPSHYHVAVFPKRYLRYVARLEGNAGAAESVTAHRRSRRYAVRKGDTLSAIARRYGTTVRRLRQANQLRSATIVAGQSLWIPTGS